MKAYTDLSQSKKLAKILPIESADMYYFRQIDSDYFPPNVESILPIPLFKDGKEDFKYDIPCWSLAALLEVLSKMYLLKPILDLEENSILYSGTNLDVRADNIFDACIEMIIKLKERDLL